MRQTSSRSALAACFFFVLLGMPRGAVAEAPTSARASCRNDPAAEVAIPRDPASVALLDGNRALREGRAVEALAAYRESARLARAAGSESAAIFADANAARAALETESPERVEVRLDALEKELKKSTTGLEPRLRARLSIHLARSWDRLAAKEQGPRAARAQMRAATLLTSAESLASEAKDDRLLSYALGYRGALYFEAGRLDEARVLSRRALLAADRAAAHDALYRWYAQIARIERSAGQDAAALAAARRAVAALTLARTDPSHVLDSTRTSFEDEVEPVYLELVDLLLERSKTAKGADRQRLLSEARDTLEGLKAEEVRDYFEDACLTAQRKVAPDEVPGAIVLYPVLLPDRLELIVGRKGELSQHTVAIGRDELDRQARDLRRSLPDRTSRVYLRGAIAIYDALIQPIEAELAEAQVLVVVPSGRLRQIPFAALYDAKKKEYLIEKIAVATTPGLTLTEPRPLPTSDLQALAAGLSESVQGYAPLTNVREEIATVSETFSSVVLLDSSFTASRFEQTIETRPVSIVHIASHGEFLPDSSESFVLTHDGKLSMNRLAAAIGRTRLRAEEPLEMLVLSACETAAGDDRAALGLAGVALQSGARSAVATLWSVSDQAAAALVSRFYVEIGKGRSRAEALRIAQVSLFQELGYRHPMYWSPFLLISNWL